MANRAAVTVEPEQTPEPGLLTWAYVTEQFFKLLKAESKEGQVRNFKTAIKFFLESSGLAEDSPVGTEMTNEFEAKIEIYIKFHITRKLKKSTYDPRVSKIRKLKLFVDENFAPTLQLQTLPKAFGQRLRKLITALGFTISSFWRTLPEGLLSYQQLWRWCVELQHPSLKSLHVIATLESNLGVPAGTLRPPQYWLRGHKSKVGQSDSGNKARAASAKPYFIWTESLEQEFRELLAHKTKAILPPGEKRHAMGQWTSSEGGGFPSAAIAKKLLKSFMGYCALPLDSPDPYLRGAGMKLESLSLALLTDNELVEQFLDFKKLRSGLRMRPADPSIIESVPAHRLSSDKKWEFYDLGGKYNNGPLKDLILISGWLRPYTGYLYQHPEYAEKLGLRITVESWHKHCRQTWDRASYILGQISKMKKEGDHENFELGRDPKALIEWILDLPRPLFILHGMIKAILDDLLPESASKVERARQYRNLILVALLCANPLRIRMFAIMEFDKNLIRQSDGSWWLRFKKGAFKNRRALKSDYRVRVAQELWPLLDRYRDEFHPVLAGSTGSKRVFIGEGNGRYGVHPGLPLTASSLSKIVQRYTEAYIPGAIGFRPHAFRHIIATDIIKRDPRLGFFLASIALHDKLETVENEYVHLKTSEFFEPVNTHFSEMWNVVFESSREESRPQVNG